jgi:hypothetical protein
MMKKSILLFYTCFILAIPAISAACPNSEYESKLRILETLTPLVKSENPSKEALMNFFEALPSDFKCFNRLFGYSDKPAPLYSEPQLYFLFPKIAEVEVKEKYTAKLVKLAINAKWEADQIGALQNAVRSTLDTHTTFFIQQLNDLDTESQSSVWAFLFGGPHPSNESLSDNTKSIICKTSVLSCELSNKVYSEALSEEHTH